MTPSILCLDNNFFLILPLLSSLSNSDLKRIFAHQTDFGQRNIAEFTGALCNKSFESNTELLPNARIVHD
jgi:hypothetical protein